MRARIKMIEANIPEGGGDHRLNLVSAIPTLADVGIDRNDSPGSDVMVIVRPQPNKLNRG